MTTGSMVCHPNSDGKTAVWPRVVRGELCFECFISGCLLDVQRECHESEESVVEMIGGRRPNAVYIL